MFIFLFAHDLLNNGMFIFLFAHDLLIKVVICLEIILEKH